MGQRPAHRRHPDRARTRTTSSIRHNYDRPDRPVVGGGGTSAIIMCVGRHPDTNVRIEDNYIDGRNSSYALYVPRQQSARHRTSTATGCSAASTATPPACRLGITVSRVQREPGRQHRRAHQPGQRRRRVVLELMRRSPRPVGHRPTTRPRSPERRRRNRRLRVKLGPRVMSSGQSPSHADHISAGWLDVTTDRVPRRSRRWTRAACGRDDESGRGRPRRHIAAGQSQGRTTIVHMALR